MNPQFWRGLRNATIPSLLLWALLWALLIFGFVSLGHAQSTVRPQFYDGTGKLQYVSPTNSFPVSGSLSVPGFTPAGTFTTLTATNISASAALPVGATVAIQNTGTTTVSCTLGVGAATALANQIQVAASSTVFVAVGSNTFGACIDQTGSASNLVVLAGGSGLGTGFGGGGGGGGSAVNTWATVALGSTAVVNYGATPPAAPVPAVNAFITNVNPNGQQSKLNSASTVIATGQVFAGQNQPGGIDGLLTGCQFNTTPTTIVSGNVSPLECDNGGNLLTSAKQGPGGASAWLVTGTGGTFPTAPPANASTNLTQIAGAVPSATNPLWMSPATGATFPVSAASLPLPTGAATSANQPTNAAQGAAIAGVTGNAVFANATTAAPVYTTATVNPLSMDTSGNLRTSVSGTVATTPPANASTNLTQIAGAVPSAANPLWVSPATGATFPVSAASLPLPTGAATAANQNTGFADVNVALATMTALNAATQVALAGSNSAAVLLSGTWVGTLVPEVSVDGGTTWVATQFYNANTHAASNTATANGTYDIMGTGGKSHARVRLSAFTSGTVTGNLRASSQAASANDSEILINTTVSGATPAGSVGTIIGAVAMPSQYPVNAATPNPAPITGNAVGTTLAVTGTLAAAAGKTTYICGLNVSSAGGAASSGPLTVGGLIGTNMVFQLPNNAAGVPVNFTQTFNPCVPASAANTAITVATGANATATAVDVNSWGYQL